MALRIPRPLVRSGRTLRNYLGRLNNGASLRLVSEQTEFRYISGMVRASLVILNNRYLNGLVVYVGWLLALIGGGATSGGTRILIIGGISVRNSGVTAEIEVSIGVGVLTIASGVPLTMGVRIGVVLIVVGNVLCVRLLSTVVRNLLSVVRLLIELMILTILMILVIILMGVGNLLAVLTNKPLRQARSVSRGCEAAPIGWPTRLLLG